jgi:ATP-dependent helicase HepA
MSEREPELGLGVVANIDAAAKRIAVDFPATGEKPGVISDSMRLARRC